MSPTLVTYLVQFEQRVRKRLGQASQRVAADQARESLLSVGERALVGSKRPSSSSSAAAATCPQSNHWALQLAGSGAASTSSGIGGRRLAHEARHWRKLGAHQGHLFEEAPVERFGGFGSFGGRKILVIVVACCCWNYFGSCNLARKKRTPPIARRSLCLAPSWPAWPSSVRPISLQGQASSAATLIVLKQPQTPALGRGRAGQPAGWM